MLKRKILASAVAATLATGLFVSGSAQAVAINPDNYGQVLLAPIYDTWDGFTNVVRVVNTNTTHAVKAKLILRSAVDSRECRDLILYLTPGDVAELVIAPLAADPFHSALYSEDDSLVSGLNNGVPVFASQVPFTERTVNADLFRPATGIGPDGRPNGDYCSIGHIEIVGAYAVQGVIQTPAGPVTVAQGMSKGDLYKIFSTARTVLNAMNPTNPPISDLMPGIPGHELTKIALLGSVDITLNPQGDRIIVPVTPLISSRDDSLVYYIQPGVPGLAYLIGHNDFDVTIAMQTWIGDYWGYGTLDNLLDIEAPLNAHSMQAIYDHTPSRLTNLITTFPTKYRHLRQPVPLDYTLGYYDRDNAYHISPFHLNGAVEYAVTSFDMFENSKVLGCYISPCFVERQYMTDETNYIWASFISQFFNAEKGWFSVDFLGAHPPVPTIAYTHRITNANSAVDVMARK